MKLQTINKSNFYDIDYDIHKYTDVNKDVSVKYADTIMKKNNTYLCLIYNEYKKIEAVIYDSDIISARKHGLYETATALQCSKHNSLLNIDVIPDINIDFIFYISPHTQIPIINSKHDLIAIVKHKRPLSYPIKKNCVVLMAGGLGMRLRPYTEKIPKPLLPIGGISILERILAHFRYYGFRNFYISVHYLSEQIEETLGDGSQFGLNIRYLHEEDWLGTGGAIALMPQQELPCLVCNGDLLMDVDLDRFLLQHIETRASGTMCVYRHAHSLNYGVVQSLNNKYCGTVEKPTHYFSINTGLYCISSEIWNYLSEVKKIDMPTLFDKMLSDNRKVCVYHHSGKWIDIGTRTEFERLSSKSKNSSSKEAINA